MDGALRRQPAAHGAGAVLRHGDGPLSPLRTARRRAAGAAVRRPVRPAGMVARPCPDRIPLEPDGGGLAGGVGHVAVRLGRGRLWPWADDAGGRVGARASGGHRRASSASDCRRAGRGGAGRPVRLWNPAPVVGPARGRPDPGASGPGRHPAGIQVEPGGLSGHRRSLCGPDGAAGGGPARRGGLARRRPARHGQRRVQLVRRPSHRRRASDGSDPADGHQPRRGRPDRRGRRPLLQQPVRLE
ncbi:hypothetical protein D3C80_1266240 [compost metagenome]